MANPHTETTATVEHNGGAAEHAEPAVKAVLHG